LKIKFQGEAGVTLHGRRLISRLARSCLGKKNRRAKRFKVNQEITIVLHDTRRKLFLADPVLGNLVDISLYGARLSIPSICAGNCHLFYTCNDDPAKIIHLEVTDGEEGERLVIPANPVWFDHVVSGPARHFEIGMEFLVPPEDPNIARLHAFLALRFPCLKKSSWLKRFFRLDSASETAL
jgi:hypothetical protein